LTANVYSTKQKRTADYENETRVLASRRKLPSTKCVGLHFKVRSTFAKNSTIVWYGTRNTVKTLLFLLQHETTLN